MLNTRSLTGLIDLGDNDKNILNFDLAKHALVYFVRGVILNLKCSSEAYLEHSRASTMEVFTKIVNDFQPLTIVAKKLHCKCSSEF